MITMYIDPGTGSMLFAILIGVIGALGYMLKSWFVKLRFILSGGKKVDANVSKLPLVIFSDDKRYWSIFKPICEELDSRGIDVTYMTASPDDKALDSGLKHLDAQFIGEGNKAFAKLNFLNASIVLSTTPGLDVFQWKRSKDVDYYVHIPHAASDITAYRMFGIDYYDAILLSGDYQIDDVRKLEKLRALPEKELLKVGIPYMDDMVKRFNDNPECEAHERTVLLAPSWGESAIFSKYGSDIIDVLIKTGYHIIVRPHPQSFKSEAEMLDSIMQKYPDSSQIEWNRDSDNFEVLKRSDILISDFSGVIFDFALVYDKPIIFADTQIDYSPYDAWWLDEPFWTFKALPRIGQKLTPDNMSSLKTMIDECLENPEYAKGRQNVREETWAHQNEGAKRTADYLVKKLDELANKKEGK